MSLLLAVVICVTTVVPELTVLSFADEAEPASDTTGDLITDNTGDDTTTNTGDTAPDTGNTTTNTSGTTAVSDANPDAGVAVASNTGDETTATVVASGTCGDNLTWSLNSDGVLTISGTGAMPDYSYSIDNAPWSDYYSSIESVVIESGVTSIDDYAFYNCENLTRVTINNGNATIGSSAIPSKATICGYTNSTAETYAKTNGNVFVNGFSITYDANGGYDAPEAQLKEHGAEITLSSDIPTRSGFKFLGWATSASATAPQYAPEGVFAADDATTLYAVWGSEEDAALIASGTCGWFQEFRPVYSTVVFTIPVAANYGYVTANDVLTLTLPVEGNYYVTVNGLNYSLGLNNEGVYEIAFGNSIHDYNGKNACLPIANYTTLTLTGGFKIQYDSNGKEIYRVSAADFKYYTDPGQNKYADSKFTTTFWPTTQHYDVKAVWNDTSVSYCWDWNPTDGSDILLATGQRVDSIFWTLDSDYVLTISGVGTMNDYEYQSTVPWYDYREVITKVIIGNGITSIGDRAFYQCEKLESIDLPESITSIGSSAFCNCYSLAEIDIPNNVTAIKDSAFESCTSLTTATLPSKLTTLGTKAFIKCGKLKSVVIPDGVTAIGSYTFSGCTSLKSVSLPERLTSIGSYAFNGCSSLVDIELPSTLTDLGICAFYECRSLKSITIPSGVTNTGYETFRSCSNLESVTLPEGLKSIGSYAFYVCSKLKTIIIPESVESIGGSAFSGSGLSSIYILNEKMSMVIGSYTIPTTATIYGWSASTAEAYAENNGYTFKVIKNNGSCGDAVSWLYSEDKKLLISGDGEMNDYTSSSHAPWYSLRTKADSVAIEGDVTNIGDYAFYNFTNLTNITIPDSVTTIGNSAFLSCYNLTSINVDSANANYKSIDGVLFTKDGKELLCYPSAKTGTSYQIPSGVTSIGNYAFSSCSNLTSVTIPDGVTNIGEDAFISCLKLTSVTIKNGYTAIGNSAIPTTAKIYGLSGSLAETYADENGNEFIPLEEDDYLPGDFDDNGQVTIADALYILHHIFDKNNYPLNQPADFNGDGNVTIADALYLLHHIFDPGKYPLE